MYNNYLYNLQGNIEKNIENFQNNKKNIENFQNNKKNIWISNNVITKDIENKIKYKQYIGKYFYHKNNNIVEIKEYNESDESEYGFSGYAW